MRSSRAHIALGFGVLLAAALFVAACDTTPPSDAETLVLEAFFDAGRPLPPVRVSRTRPVSGSVDAPAGVSGANVVVTLNATSFTYAEDPMTPGVYRASGGDTSVVVPGGARFSVGVQIDRQSATAAGSVPPRLELTGYRIDVPERPVSAVFVDTLDIGLDSLNLGIDARQGYIYPVEVSVNWAIVDATPDDPTWIQARLVPLDPFSSRILDFFLLPEQIFREDGSRVVDMPGVPNPSERTWSGVYAVPVDHADDPLPEHFLRVALLRSTAEYARFATSKTDPQRREPISNVAGGIGFAGGISVDSITVTVR
jgi:hypothetical protein